MHKKGVRKADRLFAAREVERLLEYGLKEGLLGKYDLPLARNALLQLLRLDEPYPGKLNFNEDRIPETPAKILDNLLEYAWQSGLLSENTVTRRDLFDTRLMGVLVPRPTEVIRDFWQRSRQDSIEAAADSLYQQAMSSNYIRIRRVERNSNWQAETDYGQMEITINLSKPEKDPEEIARAARTESADYPRCPLCLENMGYPGRLDHPARQNLRVIPLQLGEEEWFFQYSPYVYYHQHAIVFSSEHRPLSIDRSTFVRLLEFLEIFPHFFIGSNADLPLVGGSILSHDHFQGGNHHFPMARAEIKEGYYHPGFQGVSIGRVKWPLSVIRLSSSAPQQLIQLAHEILQAWREYSDPDYRLLASSIVDGRRVEHNTITPIARRNGSKYQLDLVLRNNRTSKEHPEGIFHPHRHLHHIKKENIGLIEVIGLAVLPGRLKQELEGIKEYLRGKASLDNGVSDWLKAHQSWIRELLEAKGSELSEQEADLLIKQNLAYKFQQVLADAGVFKDHERGRRGLEKFLSSVGIRKAGEG